MGKKATKAADNVFCQARYKMAEQDGGFESRESASEILGIERTRLANIELGKVIPYPEEVMLMADTYRSPEICNEYCAKQCAIGKQTVKLLNPHSLDRLILEILGSTQNVRQLRTDLIDICNDGLVDGQERPQFNEIMNTLERISLNVQALQLWAKKNLQEEVI